MYRVSKKNFTTFSYLHAVHSLWRMGSQIEKRWEESKLVLEFLDHFRDLVSLMEEHPLEEIRSLHCKIKDFSDVKDASDLHQILAVFERICEKDIQDSDFLITTEDAHTHREEQMPMVLILDNLRSSFNVGAIFRSAEAFGVKEIHLCGYTPTPENSKMARSALGADEWLPWFHHESVFDAMELLQKKGYTICALETSPKAENFMTCDLQEKSAIILGNERYGISPEVIKRCDQLLMIPMAGRKNSLNVGSTGSVVIYEMRKRFNAKK